MDIVIGLAIGLAVGAVVGYFVSHSKTLKLQGEIDVLKKASALQQQHDRDALENAEKRYQRELREEQIRYEKSRKEQLDRFEESKNEQQKRFDETMQKVVAQVKVATDDMLKQRQEEFSTTNSEKLGQIVNPLKETIEKMEKAMTDTNTKQTAISSEMKMQLENMLKHSESAQKSADDLANVLRHKGKVQGDWGETVLDELLKAQGLTNGIHYETQYTMTDQSGHAVVSDDNKRMRPDVVLHLDEKRDVIIDAKTSLTAFFDYVNAETEEDRQRYLKLHIESIQKHVEELSRKNYSAYVKPPKIRMDYVIMFVPHMGAMMTAMNAQPDLWRKAMEKNVFIADEQTLFAALRIVNMTWTQILQAQNHEEVFALANEMMDRVGQFVKQYHELGRALNKAQEAFDTGGRKFREGGQSILNTCRKLEKLGAKNSSLQKTLSSEYEQ